MCKYTLLAITITITITHFTSFYIFIQSLGSKYVAYFCIHVRALKAFCLCKTWISVLVLGKGEGAFNKLWTLNRDIVYLDIDSSVGTVIRLRAE